ncbi:neuronal acetylcholine receptor subunit alpha-9-like [Glandiceps talaboti]
MTVDGANASELVARLVDNYPKYKMRPVKNDSTPVEVQHRMTPRQIIEMDEKNQVLTLKAWMSSIWYDEFLTWSPSENENITEIRLPSEKVWLPDIVLLESTKTTGERDMATDVIINYRGEITAMAPVLYSASCPVDPKYFPFDEQNCNLTFMSWSYNGELLDLIPDPNTDASSFKTSSEWQLLNLTIATWLMIPPCCPEAYTMITYTIHLRRRSLFYIVNIIFPSFLACILVAVGFVLPSESGERMTLCITSVLVEFVFLETVTSFMPPNSENLPIIQKYLLVAIGVVVFSTVMTAVILNMHFKGPACKRAPIWLRNICYCILAPISCIQPNKSKWRGEFRKGELQRKNAMRAIRYRLKGKRARLFSNDAVVNTFRQAINQDRTEEEVYNERVDWKEESNVREWQELANIFDRFYFIVYLLTLGALIMTYFATVVVHSEFFVSYTES